MERKGLCGAGCEPLPADARERHDEDPCHPALVVITTYFP